MKNTSIRPNTSPFELLIPLNERSAAAAAASSFPGAEGPPVN
jgi:hypothetical protein